MKNTAIKKRLPLVLFIAAALLTAGYIAALVYDYVTYYEFGSAPFWVYVLTEFIPFMIPAGVCLCIGIVLKKKIDDDHRAPESKPH